MRVRETGAEPERRNTEQETAVGSLIWRFSAFHASKLLLLTAQVLNKFLYGGGGGWGEASPQGPTPYPFIYHFSREKYPFRIPSIEKWYPFHVPFSNFPSLLLTAVNALSFK